MPIGPGLHIDDPSDPSLNLAMSDGARPLYDAVVDFIATKVEPEVWGDAMAAMLTHVREGRVAEGMSAAVEKVGAIIAPHFPRADDDVNELPDRLIEV